MSAEDLEKYETEMELSLYREYKDIVGQFSYVVETERRFFFSLRLCFVGLGRFPGAALVAGSWFSEDGSPGATQRQIT